MNPFIQIILAWIIFHFRFSVLLKAVSYIMIFFCLWAHHIEGQPGTHRSFSSEHSVFLCGLEIYSAAA